MKLSLKCQQMKLLNYVLVMVRIGVINQISIEIPLKLRKEAMLLGSSVHKETPKGRRLTLTSAIKHLSVTKVTRHPSNIRCPTDHLIPLCKSSDI